jgi:hypothetical protein
MLISFTGSQSGMTLWQRQELEKIFIKLGLTELIHGDCIGSDLLANESALKVGCKIFRIFPSVFTAKRAYCFPNVERIHDWIEYNGVQYKLEKPDKPLERNKKIVDASELLIATPKEFTHTVRSGTWSTIRYAWKRKKEVIVLLPRKEEEELEEDEGVN